MGAFFSTICRATDGAFQLIISRSLLLLTLLSFLMNILIVYICVLPLLPPQVTKKWLLVIT